jgi:zinc transporter ZupT
MAELIETSFFAVIYIFNLPNTATAGLMIYICADELIPASCNKTTHHSTIFSLIFGTVFVVLLKGI